MSGWTFLVGLSLAVLALCLLVIAWSAYVGAYRGDHRPPEPPGHASGPPGEPRGPLKDL